MKKNAEFLASYIKEITGYELATATGQPGKGISLVIDQSIQNPEGYQLTVSDNGIRIAGSTDDLRISGSYHQRLSPFCL